jgi:hypothetical protein
MKENGPIKTIQSSTSKDVIVLLAKTLFDSNKTVNKVIAYNKVSDAQRRQYQEADISYRIA